MGWREPGIEWGGAEGSTEIDKANCPERTSNLGECGVHSDPRLCAISWEPPPPLSWKALP